MPARSHGRRGDRAAGSDEPASTFLRGLTIGAIVGAAIAGSAIWERLLRRRAKGTDRAGWIDDADEAGPRR